MKKITFVLVLSALAVSACSESSNDDNHQCNPETESCDTGDVPQCTNDTWKCDGNTLFKCVSGKWQISQTCAANTLCNAQTGSCIPYGVPQCTNNTWRCDGNTLSKCVSGYWEISQTCAANTLCNAKKGLCEPNASECRDTEHFFAGQCEADDVTHCGTHTNDCTKTSGWKDGKCIDKTCFAEDCKIGYHLNSLFDSDNIERTSCTEDTHDACGSINTKCRAEEICTQGKCTDKCQPGEVSCNGSCINPMSSQDFCGADVSCSSYIPCSEFEKCIDGKCVQSSCQNAEESLCTVDEQNICIDIHGNHPNHCGECGYVCTDKETAKAAGCSHGQCIYTCNDNMVNCGSDTEPMCLSKEQLKSDSLHCGKCDTKCAESAYCEDGQCIINACTGNECLYNNTCVNEDTHCGTQCLNCNTSNLASASVCQNGTCIITSCVAGFHLTDKGVCKINSNTACPNGNATETVNCNTLEYTKAGICEDGLCKATECQDNAHIKDNKCVADTIESCGSENNDCTQLAGWKAGTCENGKCIATTCQSGFCLNTLQGQCTNVQSSTTCGLDGNACQSCTIKQICYDGTCEAKQCTGNVCQQPTGADEEDLCQNDDTHCGSECVDCTKISNATMATCNITEGICQVTDCETGYHIYNNACEEDSTTHCGEHGISCDVNQTCMGGRCLGNKVCDGTLHNTLNDLDHCGDCNHRCADGLICDNGQCKAGNGNAYCDGQKVVTGTLDHCSGCNDRCADSLICKDNACVKGAGMTYCSDVTINSLDNIDNCGACNNKCGEGLICSNGECKTGNGIMYCNGVKVDSSSDSAHCSGCNILCPAETSCTLDGFGTPTCNKSDGYAICSGKDIDRHHDSLNCGQCGKSCGVGEICTDGLCTLGTGETYCNQIGISMINTSHDFFNCGQCDKSCSTGEACKNGTCIDYEVGGTIAFGNYNGTPIQWYILDIDESNHRLMLVSMDILDSKLYTAAVENFTVPGVGSYLEYISWKASSIRTWLNVDFISSAFTSEELSRIPTVDITNQMDNFCSDYYPSWAASALAMIVEGNTSDKVFLLSLPEVETFLGTNDMICTKLHCTTPWWLRTTGCANYNAAHILGNGSIKLGDGRAALGVRPALWLNY